MNNQNNIINVLLISSNDKSYELLKNKDYLNISRIDSLAVANYYLLENKEESEKFQIVIIDFELYMSLSKYEIEELDLYNFYRSIQNYFGDINCKLLIVRPSYLKPKDFMLKFPNEFENINSLIRFIDMCDIFLEKSPKYNLDIPEPKNLRSKQSIEELNMFVEIEKPDYLMEERYKAIVEKKTKITFLSKKANIDYLFRKIVDTDIIILKDDDRIVESLAEEIQKLLFYFCKRSVLIASYKYTLSNLPHTPYNVCLLIEIKSRYISANKINDVKKEYFFSFVHKSDWFKGELHEKLFATFKALTKKYCDNNNIKYNYNNSLDINLYYADYVTKMEADKYSEVLEMFFKETYSICEEFINLGGNLSEISEFRNIIIEKDKNVIKVTIIDKENNEPIYLAIKNKKFAKKIEIYDGKILENGSLDYQLLDLNSLTKDSKYGKSIMYLLTIVTPVLSVFIKELKEKQVKNKKYSKKMI